MSKAMHAHITTSRFSPPRRAFHVEFASMAASPKQSAPSDRNPWAPTELGCELLDLLPTYAAAMFVDCNTIDAKSDPEYDAKRSAAAVRAVDQATRAIDRVARAIISRPATEHAHLTDLAIVQQFNAARQGSEYVDRETHAANAMSKAILALGGVKASAYSVAALYKAAERAAQPRRHRA
jgi:hypothetical protein